MRNFTDGLDICHYQLSSGKFARPGSKASYAPDQELDTQHICLNLNLDIPKKTVHGQCTTIFRALHDGVKEVHFDALRMNILSVTLPSKQNLKTKYNKEKLTVHLPSSIKENDLVTIIIDYRLIDPIAGVYFIGPDKAYPKKPVQVWTHGEAEESRYWFPCFDAPHDKATTEMIATVPQDFFALSNGALKSVTENKKEKTKTYHWKQSIPHSPYLVTLAAGKFSEIKDEWDGIPILYYVEPGREEEIKRAFGKTPKMVQFFSEKIGIKYPYEKYAQIAVADFLMGGMEHTTATTQTDRVLMDAQAYPEFTADWLVSHELAHQWFGDLLTCKEWSHAWLNESFATYFEALFAEHDLGKDEFDYEMRDKSNIYFEEGKETYQRAIVTNIYRKPDDLFDRHLYEKGACVLHLLRSLLGTELFWKSIHHYVTTFQGKAVETADLINSIQEATGKNMRKFFDQWVFRAGHPEYTVHYWWDKETKKAHIQIQQKGDEKALFSLPIALEFITSSGKKRFTETVEEKKHEFSYKFPTEPLDFRFDPDHSILKKLTLSKPYSAWMKQLASDSHVLGRIDAAKEVAKVNSPESLPALMRAFKKEKFWGASKEIAMAIGSMKVETARNFLIQSLEVKHPKVRRGVVEALGTYTDEETVHTLINLFNKEKSYFVRGEIVRCVNKSRSPQRAALLQKAFNTPSWNDLIQASAISSLADAPESKSFKLIQEQSRYGKSLSARQASLGALTRLAKSFSPLYEELLALTKDPHARIKLSAITALGNLKDPRAIPVLEKISKDKNLPYRFTAAAEDALLKIKPSNFGTGT